MLLNTLQWQILKPFVDETVHALEVKLGLTVEADDGFQENVKDFNFNGYAVVANTAGSVEGRILIHHYTETALVIGNKILQAESLSAAEMNGMTDKISNALADFTYLSLEPAVKQLENSDLKVKFSPAFFIADTSKIDAILAGITEIITVPIKVEGVGRFYLNYLLVNKII